MWDSLALVPGNCAAGIVLAVLAESSGEFEIEVREVGQRVPASHCTYRQNYVG
jgi:hypothetical protein